MKTRPKIGRRVRVIVNGKYKGQNGRLIESPARSGSRVWVVRLGNGRALQLRADEFVVLPSSSNGVIQL